MKKILLFIGLFASVAAVAQLPTTDSIRSYTDLYVRNSAIPPFTNLRLNLILKSLANLIDSTAVSSGATINLSRTNGTTSITITPSGGGTAVVIDSANSTRSGVLTVASWKFLDSLHRGLIALGGGSGSTSLKSPSGTGFRVAIIGTDSIKSLLAGYGLTLDSTTHGKISAIIDTAALRGWVSDLAVQGALIQVRSVGTGLSIALSSTDSLQLLLRKLKNSRYITWTADTDTSAIVTLDTALLRSDMNIGSGGGGTTYTVGAFNGTSTANVASIAGSVLTIHGADATNPGAGKLYTGTGTNTDGSMTQNAINTALALKVDKTTTVNGNALSSNVTVTDANLSTSNVTTNNASTSKHGFVPILPNDATKYFDGTGNYTVPAGAASIYNVKSYGAAGDGKEIQGAGSVTGTAFTSSVATFVSGDVGKIIMIDGAGTSGRDFVTTISAYVSSTAVTLTASATTSVSSKRFVYGTDCTSGIQSALNAAAAAGAGKVFIPNGLYLIGGALITSGSNPNCQILVPSPASSRDTAGASSITIEGEGSPNYIGNDVFNSTAYWPTKKGSVLLSTISGSGQAASVIGTKGPSTAFDSLNYTNVNINNITIQVRINPTGVGATMGGINASRSATFNAYNILVTVDGAMWQAPIPTSDVAGIIMPKVNAETVQTLKTTLVVGFRYGYVTGEHTSMDQVQAVACYSAFATSRVYHPWYGARIAAFWCRRVLEAPTATFVTMPSGGTEFTISQLDVEQFNPSSTGPDPTSWIDTTTVIYDPGPLMAGNIYGYTLINGLGNGSGDITRTGGANVHATKSIAKMNQQELIGGPQTPYSISSGLISTDSAAVLEINSGITASTSKNYSDLIQSHNQTGTSNTVARRLVINRAIGGTDKRLYEDAVLTDGATNTSRYYSYVMKAGTLTATHEIGSTSFDFKLPIKGAAWTVSGRPSSPSAGWLGYNSDSSKYEFYNGSAWTILGAGGGGGGYSLPSLTTGSVIFKGASDLAQDNSNFFWDASNIRHGIGTNSPSQILDIRRTGANNARVNIGTNAAAQYSSVDWTTDGGLNAQMLGTGSTFGTAPFGSNSAAFVAYLSGGMNLIANHASGAISFFTGGSTTSNLKITSAGVLQFNTTPASGASTDSVLTIDGSGNVKKRNQSLFAGSTPTLDAVLNAGATLTANRTITNSTFNLTHDQTSTGVVKFNGLKAGVGTEKVIVHYADSSLAQVPLSALFTSGTYTPTLTGTTNVTGTPSLSQATYIQVGNIVNVTVSGLVVPTAAAPTLTTFTISLPISTATTTQNGIGQGSFTTQSTINEVSGRGSLVSGTAVQFSYTADANAGTNHAFTVTFMYKTN